MIYDELRKKRLKRNEQSFYTLNVPELDSLFCINSELTLTPNPCHIVNFAAINYLYGLFGISIDSFTAVPSGFIASYAKIPSKKENEENSFYSTFWLSDTLNVLNDLLDLCERKISLGTDKEIYIHIRNILENKNTSLLEKSLLVSGYIKENNIRIFDNNIAFSDKKYQEVNNQNCEDNHKVLKDVVSSSDQKFSEILNSFILPGYLQYRGYDRDNNPIEQNGQILNDFDRLLLLMSTLGYDSLPYYEQRNKLSNIISILNMCSTDYSADIVYNLFKEIIECKQHVALNNVHELASNMIEKTIPPAQNNEELKQETRNRFRR